MIPSWRTALGEAFPGRVQWDAPLAPFTTYRIGGPADALLEPARAEDVQHALACVREHAVPWIVLGLGSNVLVSDAGWRGLVLRMAKPMASAVRDGPRWRVGAGFPTPLLARRTAAEGLSGVHRLVGVPGTVGGGVYMNAGAHGQEFRQTVRRITLVTADGEVQERMGSTIPWAYRSSGLGPVAVLETELALEPADPVHLKAEIDEHLRWRKAGTPFSEPCCGSVFRNPSRSADEAEQRGRGGTSGSNGRRTGSENGPRTAGQLIEAAGMKGFRVGGAEVSRLHANYIVNTGGATAADVLAVIEAVRRRVREESGVGLELEVKLIDSR
jgi:UDP-N-acetylmuramate dehydrogenase